MNTAQTIMSGFDISNLDSADTNQITNKVVMIEDEDGEAVTGFIIVGKNSQEYQNASNAIRIEGIKRASKRNKQIDTSTDEGASIVSRTVSANEKTIAMAVTVDWFGFNKEGEPIPFDKAIVEKLFEKYPQWQAKVNSALESDKNFMKV